MTRERDRKSQRTELGKILAVMDRHRLDRRRLIVGSAATAGAALLASTSSSAAQDATPQPGGRVIIGLIQEPGQLSEFFNGQSGSFISTIAVEPLFIPNAAGEYQPILASEVPTLENGGISEDFLTITYRLREGITWSDGEPFTADDIVFTFDVFKDPASTPLVGAAYDPIESVTAIDPTTVEVKMSSINPGYLDLFQSPLPKHKFDSTAITGENELARIPLGTGPFVITEWSTGSEIIFERNTNYREEGKPYLDGITVRVTPEKEAAIASMIAGDLDFIYFIVTGDLETIQEAQDSGAGVSLIQADGGASTEWLWFNLGTEGDPSKPHPVLGDLAIRRAFDLAIDRQSIIDEVLGGFGLLNGSFIFAGWAAEEIDPPAYDPDAANQLLDEAGWVMGNDGVREKDGVRASLRYQTIAGDLVRELYQQVVQQNMGDVGIELTIENVPSNTIFGSWEEGGILARGQFDILMSRDGYFVDPLEWVAVFTTGAIPSEANPGGFTYDFLSDEEVDRLANEAGATLDQATRAELYKQLNARLLELQPAIPLYRSASATAFRDTVQGYDIDYFDILAVIQSAENWYLTEA